MRGRERKNERASEEQEREREITIAFSGCIICDWQLGFGNKDIAIFGFQKIFSYKLKIYADFS